MHLQRKNSSTGRLRRQQRTRFLLSFVLIVATLYVALQFDFNRPLPVSLNIDMNKLVEDLDITLPADADAPREETVLAEQPEVVEEIQTVELVEEQPKEPVSSATDIVATNEEGVAQESKVEHLIPSEVLDENKPIPSHLVEQMPQYPGGMSAFVQWLTQNLRYPAQAQKNRRQGRAVATFIVNTDGTISNLCIERADHQEFAQEALRVLSRMKNWTPGQQKGQPCRTLVAIPVDFKL